MNKLTLRNFLFIFSTIISILYSSSSMSNILDITTPAKQLIIYDHEVDQVLFQINADELMKPASMAKVMTAYIVFDRIKDTNTLQEHKNY